MECQICIEDLGDSAYSLPCGHIYCETCISGLQQIRTRSHSIECPSCRRTAPSRFSSDNIRRVFLNSNSSQTQSLQARLRNAEKERDNAFKDFGRLMAGRIDPFLQAISAKDALLASRDKELASMKAELEGVKAALAEANRKAKSDLQARDAEINKLKKFIASPSSLTSTTPPGDSGAATYNDSDSSDHERTLVNISSTDVQAFRFTFQPEALSRRIPQANRTSSIGILRNEAKNTVSSAQSSPVNPRSARPTITEVTSPQGRKAERETPKAKKRELKTGNDILWRGYGRPRETAVPECTASDGYHYFSGKGTNQYKTKYTCTICRFTCSER